MYICKIQPFSTMKDKKIITKGIALSISLLGIVLLLALQFIWFKSAYQISEQNLKEKCISCFVKAINQELIIRFTDKSTDPKDKSLDVQNKKSTTDVNLTLQDLSVIVHKFCNIKRVDSIFSVLVKNEYGYVPKHQLRISNSLSGKQLSYFINDKTVGEDYLNKVLIDNNIHQNAVESNPSNSIEISMRLNSCQVIGLVIADSSMAILNQSWEIFIGSIFLVIIIAFTLIYLLNSALRENRFVRFIKEYTHALTHDLRSPLNSINMASSILYDDTNPIDEKQKKNYLRICMEQSRSMLDNIERILTVAKTEQTQLMAHKMKVVLQSFLSSVSAAFVDNNVHIKPIEVTVHCESDNELACIDPVLMTNVLNNLMDNAVKYSYETVKITIHAFIIDNWWHISVKDDGMGIPANDLEAIFEQFNQGSLLERKRMFGYGIGLTFTKKVINAHGGTLQITSKEMEGSEFTILLPTI